MRPCAGLAQPRFFFPFTFLSFFAMVRLFSKMFWKFFLLFVIANIFSEIKVHAQPQMVLVQGGTFTMGCTPEQQADCLNHENPAHKVTLSDFEIGIFEVTQGQWESLFGSQPSWFLGCGPNCPVDRVSWFDAIVFCNRLSEQQGYLPCYYSNSNFSQIYGKNGNTWTLPNGGTVFWNRNTNGYRLLTEAEWEFASRGGIKSLSYKFSGSNSIGDVAWYFTNSSVTYTPNVNGHGPHQVGLKFANELGIYDMSGNIIEWCFDWYDSNYYALSQICDPQGSNSGTDRVRRGGSWGDNSPNNGSMRVSDRAYNLPNLKANGIGFRIGRSI